ncbi:hypothetical protein JTB14_004490 [Gonioctena quinquepunctata]|nr:hypothetical protein JTB14_004490 [Gonioctena quinquepunctata]
MTSWYSKFWPKSYWELEESLCISNNQLYELISKSLKEEVQTLHDSLNSVSQKLKEKLTRRNEIVDILEKENAVLRSENKYVEKKLKRNNILIHGLEIGDDNTISNTVDQLQILLDVEIDCERHVNNIYEVGNPDKENRPIVVEFITTIKKLKVLKNSFKLENKNIYINNDLTKEDRTIEATLRKYMKKYKEKNVEAEIKNNTPIVNGTIVRRARGPGGRRRKRKSEKLSDHKQSIRK